MKFSFFQKDYLKIERWPSKNQWRQLFKILTKKERIIFSIFALSFLGSLFFLAGNFYLKNTEIKPRAGGVYREGVVGAPRFINPIYPNQDIDRDLLELLFSGLMKYDSEGKLVPDLAKDYQIKEEGKIYEFYLRDNVFWSDGKKLTADDIIFTIKTIQDSDYKSPLRANWLGVEVEKIDDFSLRFRLKNSYAGFLERTTQKIIPAHIWQEISPPNFPLAIYNLQPVSSGPYQFLELEQDKLGHIKSLTLVRNPNYFGRMPYLDKIIFLFFSNEEELIKRIEKKEVDGFSISSVKNYLLFKKAGFEDYHFSMPRYFAVFFNPEKSEVLSEIAVRKALNYGTNKEEILEKILFGQGKIVNSPILPELYDFEQPSISYQFDPNKAKEILEEAGFIENKFGQRVKILKAEPVFRFTSNLRLGSRGKEVRELQKCLSQDPEVYPEGEITGFFGNRTKIAVIRFQEKYRSDILEPWGFEKGTGLVSETTRQKLNEICFSPQKESMVLKFSLVTVDQPVLIELANLLKTQWQNLGIEIEIEAVDISRLEKEIIKPRNYQSLLFGQALFSVPDPIPFWHSSYKKDPGLNLSLYENKKADQYLEEARKSLQREILAEKLAQFQNILLEEAPAIFLYNPDYIYFVDKKIKGIKTSRIITDPAKRFVDIESWHIKTKRSWK